LNLQHIFPEGLAPRRGPFLCLISHSEIGCRRGRIGQRNLGPLSGLKKLRALQLAGGIWSKLAVQSLAPLAHLDALEELRFASLRMKDASLRALAKLQRLKTLTIPSGAASMEEFARLSVRLPHVACPQRHPYVRFDGVVIPVGTDPIAALDEIGDDTVLVTGKGKPFLQARRDRERLLRYCADFEAACRSSAD
jgi:hypothetical protein